MCSSKWRVERINERALKLDEKTTCRWWEPNPQPSHYVCDALPVVLQRRLFQHPHSWVFMCVLASATRAVAVDRWTAFDRWSTQWLKVLLYCKCKHFLAAQLFLDVSSLQMFSSRAVQCVWRLLVFQLFKIVSTVALSAVLASSRSRWHLCSL